MVKRKNHEDIEDLRQQIDQIDNELLRLFEARMELVQKIADYKRERNLKVLDESREKKVLEKTASLTSPILQKHAASFFRALMDISKTLQAERFIKTKSGLNVPAGDRKVGFQGLPGSYSEQAVREYFGERSANINYVGFEDVFKALQAGEIEYGILPLENSFTGGIAEVYDLLFSYGFYIVGEQCVQVDHNLLAPLGVKLEDIREVYSHPQALLQCSSYLKTHPEWHHVSCSNTAVSAKLVADSVSGGKAAIASRRAGELYGLSILVQSINNHKGNSTKFIIIGKQPEFSEENNKISIAAAIAHEPGSLHRILGHFAKNGLNMLKIESRPIADKTWEYLFYIDFEGNMKNQEVRNAIEEIKQDSTFFRLLGNYRSDQRK